MQQNNNKRIVIVGGVAAGAKTAAKARREDPNAEIHVFTDEEFISYAGCGEPYFISGEVQERDQLLARTPEQFKAVFCIDIHTQHRVTRIDANAKTIDVIDCKTDAKRTEPFDVLVLATGARPIVPRLPGIDLRGVYTLRTVPDAVRIREHVETGTVKEAFVIGGGFIGLEMVESLTARGVNVTLVEMLPQLAPQYDADLAAHIQRAVESRGVTVMLNSPLEAMIGDENGNLKAVKIAGSEYPADLVLISCGVRPNTELAKEAGVVLGKTGAIQVNDELQTNYPFIYAAGDCAETMQMVTRKPVWVPLGSTANRQGRVLGVNVAGGNAKFPGILGTSIFRIFELNVARTGLTEKEAKEEGIDYEIVIVPVSDLPHYMPGGKNVVIKMLADRKTRRIIGAQVWGPGKVDKTIDTIATAMTFEATVDDATQLDLAYAPPFAPPLGNAVTAANVLQNKLDRKTEGILPSEILEKEKRGDDFVLLDVRNPDEIDAVCLEKSTNIPLPQLRKRYSELPKDKEIISSCGLGLRGSIAYRILKQLGFPNVKYLDGGVIAWPKPIPKVKK
ncbi:MAG: dehydrogenase [Candidatus Omnitrophota bacterium]|jgi:NADPH-dependent 2,4-dienoyl-CoA reductase/sulfur reductase-like enzyme/rhodanese-related sulfurtransferase|nr:MAG: dehydrogenase [Candidatus Omnitrophota bacterium]